MLARITIALIAWVSALQGGAIAAACERLAPDAGFVSAALAPGERRVAFVAGAGAYQELPQLPNPPRDAQAISRRLAQLGFEVFAAVNPNTVAFNTCFSRFEVAAARASVALFYYSGHGVQFGDSNYITVVDSRLVGVQAQAFIALDDLMVRLSRLSAARLIFLDACRDNPLAGEAIGAGAGARSIRAGLAPPRQGAAGPAGGGQFIAYSTSPNATAADGTGTLSPFSQAFVSALGTPGVSVQQMMSEVNRAVGEATNFAQTPWTRSSLTRDIYLNGRLDAAALHAASEAFAGESERLLDVANDRDGAIAAALKGIPFSAPPHAAPFAAARRAYQRAVRTLRLRLPIRLGGAAQAHAIISNDTRRVMVAQSDATSGQVTLWNAQNGTRLANVATSKPFRVAINIAFSPDSTRAVILDEGTGEFQLLDASTGAVLQRFTVRERFTPQEPGGLEVGPYGIIGNLVLSNGGARVLVVASPHSFIWDSAARRVLLQVEAASPGRFSADIRGDGAEAMMAAPALRQVAPRSFTPQEGTPEQIHRFNLSTGALIWSSEPLEGVSPRYTRNGTYVLAHVSGFGRPERLRVYNARSGAFVAQQTNIGPNVDPSERRIVDNLMNRTVYEFPSFQRTAAGESIGEPVLHKILSADGVEISSFLSPTSVIWQPPAPMDAAALEARRLSLQPPLAAAVERERLRATALATRP